MVTDGGTSAKVTITQAGHYRAKAQGTDGGAAVTAVLAAKIVYTPVASSGASLLSFHHGNFDDAHGDGTVGAAADNGACTPTQTRGGSTRGDTQHDHNYGYGDHVHVDSGIGDDGRRPGRRRRRWRWRYR